MTGVYAIVHRESGRRYVGSSYVIGRRWYEHLSQLAYGKHHSAYLQNAWNKYGPSAFDFVVVELCSKSDLLAREQAWIDWAQAADPLHGFNVSAVAGMPAMTPEAIERGAAKRRGRKRPIEVGQKIAASLRGQRMTAERKAKIAAAHKGRKRGPHSAEHRANLSKAHMGRKLTAEDRRKVSEHHWSKSPQAADVLARMARTREANKQKRQARDLPLLADATLEVVH